MQLEQLECLRCEDTPTHPHPHRLMITHTTESYWIPSQRRQRQSYKFKELAKISIFLILKQALHMTHLLELFDKMCKHEMDLIGIVEDTKRTPFCP